MQNLNEEEKKDVSFEVLQVAFGIYKSQESPGRKDCLKKMAAQLPGLTERQYADAWNRVDLLFEQSCKLAFRWANENPAGAEIDEDLIEQLFLDELARKCRGFTKEQYKSALDHGFDRGIF